MNRAHLLAMTTLAMGGVGYHFLPTPSVHNPPEREFKSQADLEALEKARQKRERKRLRRMAA